MNKVGTETARKKSLPLSLIIGDGTAENVILILLTVSVWVHYVASAVMIVALLIAILLIPSTRKKLLCQKELLFCGTGIALFSFLVSVIAENLIGMAISAGVLVTVALGAFAKSVMTHKRFRGIQTVWCIGSIVSCLIALWQNFIEHGESPAYRPMALAFNPNYYGALVAMTVIMCICNIFDGRYPNKDGEHDVRYRLFYLGALLVNCVALFVCECRSALLAVTACTVLYMLITGRYILVIVGVAAAVGIWTLGWFYPEIMSWTNSLSASFTVRADIWKESLRSFSQSPYTAIFGRGPMTYYHVKEAEGLFEADHAHNILFDTLLNVGIIGTAMYALLFAYLIKEIFEAYKEGDKRAFAIGALFTVEIAVQGIADVTVMWHQSAVLFFLALSLTGARKNTESAAPLINGGSQKTAERRV